MGTSITITPRKKRDGKISYTAQIRVKEGGRVVHSEAKTSSRKTAVSQWAERRRRQIEDKGLVAPEHKALTLADLVRKYIEEYSAVNEFGRSKMACLKYLEKTDLAQKPALSLSQQDFIEHIMQRRRNGAGPSTANNDLIWSRVVFRAARSAWGMPVDISVIDDAGQFLRAEGMTAKANDRERRPTLEELEKLTAYFKERDQYRTIPMHDLMWFAIYSARREAEICNLLWSDNDASDHTGMVRNLKHPKKKKGNNKRFKYTPEGWAIVQRQPKVKGEKRIFPYNSKTVCSYFTDACKILEIEDLHFHDMRHEATSRLFEQGYSITEVQQFTLHMNWNTLKKYTHLRPGQVKHR